MSRTQISCLLTAVLLFSVLLSNCSTPPSGTQATLTAIYQNNQNQALEPTSTVNVSETPTRIETTAPTQTFAPEPTFTQEPAATVTQPPALTAASASNTLAPTRLPTSDTPAQTAEPRKTAKYWSEWPLIPPNVSSQAKEIYQRGLALGNDPHAFSTIGDCQSAPSVFMGTYDTDSYVLGDDYLYLEKTISQFKGSFERQSITVRDGLSVASVFSPAWADPNQCNSGETPLECEFRIHKPSIVFINLGTNWRGGDDVTHTEYLRKIVDFSIAHGVVPILSSKGDNLEGDHRLNRSMAQVAYDYELPFWNFWRSIRDLPGKGIDDSRPGGYLTTEAWGRRSFTGLQALDAVWGMLNH